MSNLSDGIVERLPDETHIIRIQGSYERFLAYSGVYCENPSDPKDSRIYAKEFKKKRIYLSNEIQKARNEILFNSNPNHIVIGLTGYSVITPENLETWGLSEGSYERACEEVLVNIVAALQRAYPGVNVAIAEGASPMGVDLAAINAARHLEIAHLGHSCPRYMMGVVDDEDPVLVMPTQKQYSDEFIESLHILCSVGGRSQALIHDIDAAIRLNKRVLFFNLIRAISSNLGGPAARSKDGQIEDGTAAFLNAVRIYDPRNDIDEYEGILDFVKNSAVSIARKTLPPDIAFGAWKVTR